MPTSIGEHPKEISAIRVGSQSNIRTPLKKFNLQEYLGKLSEKKIEITKSTRKISKAVEDPKIKNFIRDRLSLESHLEDFKILVPDWEQRLKKPLTYSVKRVANKWQDYLIQPSDDLMKNIDPSRDFLLGRARPYVRSNICIPDYLVDTYLESEVYDWVEFDVKEFTHMLDSNKLSNYQNFLAKSDNHNRILEEYPETNDNRGFIPADKKILEAFLPLFLENVEILTDLSTTPFCSWLEYWYRTGKVKKKLSFIRTPSFQRELRLFERKGFVPFNCMGETRQIPIENIVTEFMFTLNWKKTLLNLSMAYILWREYIVHDREMLSKITSLKGNEIFPNQTIEIKPDDTSLLLTVDISRWMDDKDYQVTFEPLTAGDKIFLKVVRDVQGMVKIRSVDDTYFSYAYDPYREFLMNASVEDRLNPEIQQAKLKESEELRKLHDFKKYLMNTILDMRRIQEFDSEKAITFDPSSWKNIQEEKDFFDTDDEDGGFGLFQEEIDEAMGRDSDIPDSFPYDPG